MCTNRCEDLEECANKFLGDCDDAEKEQERKEEERKEDERKEEERKEEARKQLEEMDRIIQEAMYSSRDSVDQ